MGLSWKNIWQSNFFLRKTIVNSLELQRTPSSWRGKLSESRIFPQETQGQEMRQWALPGQTHINLTFEFEWGFFFYIFIYLSPSHILYPYCSFLSPLPSQVLHSTPPPHSFLLFPFRKSQGSQGCNLNTSEGDQSYYNLSSISDHVTKDKPSSLLVRFPHPWTSSTSPFSFLLPSHVLHCCEAWRR